MKNATNEQGPECSKRIAGQVSHLHSVASGEENREMTAGMMVGATAQSSPKSLSSSSPFTTFGGAGEQAYDALLNLCVWAKDNGGMGSFYRSQHELVFVWKSGRGSQRNNVQLRKFGRNRTNVWQYPGANPLSRTGQEDGLLAMRPTVKSVQLLADALLDAFARGEIVLDPFLGSGSTLLAAERVGRVCYGIEMEPRYVDLAIRR